MAKKKQPMSFFDFMMHNYAIDIDRYTLAVHMMKLARRHPEIKQINSLADLMIASEEVFTNPDAKRAATGDLWCEYCCRTGRPLTGQEE